MKKFVIYMMIGTKKDRLKSPKGLIRETVSYGALYKSLGNCKKEHDLHLQLAAHVNKSSEWIYILR